MGNHSTIPIEPTLVFRGERKGPDFVAGAMAMRKLLLDVNKRFEESVETDEDIRREGAAFVDPILQVLNANADSREGFAAALANWLMANVEICLDPEQWVPLERRPVYSMVDGGDHFEPPEGSVFFEVARQPVSVGEELAAYEWKENGPLRLALKTVRTYGKPITRERFDAMRAAQKRKEVPHA